MHKPKVVVLRGAGTNCDYETKCAFEYAGAEAELVHINEFTKLRKSLANYHILAIPGGFTYGDDIAAGKILANELKYKLNAELQKFITDGKLIIGICNGFQILVKSSLLPDLQIQEQSTTLTSNDSGKFEDRWVYLRPPSFDLRKAKCVWTKGIAHIIYLPVAHGEGKFVAANKKVLRQLKNNSQIVFQYCSQKGKLDGYPVNPNGSQDNIAGICDKTGRIFGLMPHPERHILREHHPHWTRIKDNKKEGDGLSIFRNGVQYAKKNL